MRPIEMLQDDLLDAYEVSFVNAMRIKGNFTENFTDEIRSRIKDIMQELIERAQEDFETDPHGKFREYNFGRQDDQYG